MNILNLPEFEVIDIIQDEHDMTVIVKSVKVKINYSSNIFKI